MDEVSLLIDILTNTTAASGERNTWTLCAADLVTAGTIAAAHAVTPDSSPETTLTSEEAENLRDSFALNMAVQNMVRKNSFKDSSESDFVVSSHRRNKSCPVHIDEIFA